MIIVSMEGTFWNDLIPSVTFGIGALLQKYFSSPVTALRYLSRQCKSSFVSLRVAEARHRSVRCEAHLSKCTLDETGSYIRAVSEMAHKH